MTDKRRPYSSVIVDGLAQTPSRAMLRAVGFDDEDFKKPQIGIASTWSMVTPCNMHIDELADHAEAGANAAGAKAVVFNTITVSDGISMGTPGMRYSLVSREVPPPRVSIPRNTMRIQSAVVIQTRPFRTRAEACRIAGIRR